MHLSTVASSSGPNDEGPPQQKKKKLNDHAPSLLLQLPDEISLNCIARVPRCYHPSVSLVSTTLRGLIASRELYVERSLLRRSENVLYVSLRSNDPTETPRWYILNSKSFGQVMSHSLVPVPTFPFVPSWGSSTVTVGSEIYVIGGCVDDKSVSTAFVIDCPSYTCRFLPSMKRTRACAAAGIVDGKLYVIGGCKRRSANWVEAFDLKTQTWESVKGLYNVKVCERTIRSFVMDDKVCFMDRESSFVYDPKEGTLERDRVLNDQWSVSSCVIGNKLYSWGRNDPYELLEFDPVARVWSEVKGLRGVPGSRLGSKLVNYGGRIMFLCTRGECSTETWCTEIELERKEGGEVWGKILWSGLVFASEDPSVIVQSLAVSF